MYKLFYKSINDNWQVFNVYENYESAQVNAKYLIRLKINIKIVEFNENTTLN